jgi:hypothetical protein
MGIEEEDYPDEERGGGQHSADSPPVSWSRGCHAAADAFALPVRADFPWVAGV